MMEWKSKYEAYMKKIHSSSSSNNSSLEGNQPRQLEASLENNLNMIHQHMNHYADLVVRQVRLDKRDAALLFLTSITDQKLIQEGIVAPMQSPFLSFPMSWIWRRERIRQRPWIRLNRCTGSECMRTSVSEAPIGASCWT